MGMSQNAKDYEMRPVQNERLISCGINSVNYLPPQLQLHECLKNELSLYSEARSIHEPKSAVTGSVVKKCIDYYSLRINVRHEKTKF